MKVKKKSGRKFDPWESLAISFMKVKKKEVVNLISGKVNPDFDSAPF